MGFLLVDLVLLWFDMRDLGFWNFWLRLGGANFKSGGDF